MTIRSQNPNIMHYRTSDLYGRQANWMWLHTNWTWRQANWYHCSYIV